MSVGRVEVVADLVLYDGGGGGVLGIGEAPADHAQAVPGGPCGIVAPHEQYHRIVAPHSCRVPPTRLATVYVPRCAGLGNGEVLELPSGA